MVLSVGYTNSVCVCVWGGGLSTTPMRKIASSVSDHISNYTSCNFYCNLPFNFPVISFWTQ